MNKRANSLTRSLAVAAAAAVLVAPSAAAADDVLTPERRARLDPALQPGAVLQTQQTWTVAGTRDAPVPGVPGDRHQFRVAVSDAENFPVTGFPAVDVFYAAQTCPTPDTCELVLAVTGRIVEPASGLNLVQGGTAHLDLVIDESTPGVQVIRGATAPTGPLRIRATLAPSTPVDTTITFANARSIRRIEGPEGGAYVAAVPESVGPTVASGTVFGVPLGAGDTGQVAVFPQLGERLPALGPVQTAAERRPYVPRVSGGAVVDDVDVFGHRDGVLARTPTTSTGRALPGNRHLLRAGASAADGGTSVAGGLESRTCAAGQAWDECTPVADPAVLTPRGAGSVVAGPDGTLAATRTFAVAPQSRAGRDPDAWGTIRLTAAWAPGRSGSLTRAIDYEDGATAARVSGGDRLSYGTGEVDAEPPVAAAALGTAAVTPAGPGDVSTLVFNRSFEGTITPPV